MSFYSRSFNNISICGCKQPFYAKKMKDTFKKYNCYSQLILLNCKVLTLNELSWCRIAFVVEEVMRSFTEVKVLIPHFFIQNLAMTPEMRGLQCLLMVRDTNCKGKSFPKSIKETFLFSTVTI